MAYFYFAVAPIDVHSLLKLEISQRFPSCRLSYSRLGFFTFKSDLPIQFKPYFALYYGECFGKFDFPATLTPEFNQNIFALSLNETLILPKLLNDLKLKEKFDLGQKLKIVIMINEAEFWWGEMIIDTKVRLESHEKNLNIKKNVISRAYYKLSEAMEWADIKMNPGENVLELGASPGGASQFLLEKGWKVYGVDPAKMDERLTSWIQQGQFIHLPSPFELLSIEDLRFTSHLIVCDINLPPSVVVREIIRLIVLMKKNAQQIPHTILINLKMTDDTFINQLEIYQKRFLELGFKRCRLKMLPSHRKEIALLAQYEGK